MKKAILEIELGNLPSKEIWETPATFYHSFFEFHKEVGMFLRALLLVNCRILRICGNRKDLTLGGRMFFVCTRQHVACIETM